MRWAWMLGDTSSNLVVSLFWSRSWNLSSCVDLKTRLCKVRVICICVVSAPLSHHFDQVFVGGCLGFAMAIIFCTYNTPNVVSLTNENDHSQKQLPLVHSAFRSCFLFTYLKCYTEVLVVSWLLRWKMDMETWVQILDRVVCISHSANSLESNYSLAIVGNY